MEFFVRSVRICLRELLVSTTNLFDDNTGLQISQSDWTKKSGMLLLKFFSPLQMIYPAKKTLH